MRNNTFVWDDGKAASNYADHGVTFEASRAVFKTPLPLSGSMIVKTTAKNGMLFLGWWSTVYCMSPTRCAGSRYA